MRAPNPVPPNKLLSKTRSVLHREITKGAQNFPGNPKPYILTGRTEDRCWDSQGQQPDCHDTQRSQSMTALRAQEGYTPLDPSFTTSAAGVGQDLIKLHERQSPISMQVWGTRCLTGTSLTEKGRASCWVEYYLF